MIDKQPILIAGPPRTGTTMLAGLIFKHGGFWIGRSRTTMYPGTNSNFGSENIDIKDIMKGIAKKIGYKNWDENLPNYEFQPHEVDAIKHKIEKFVPEDTRWIVKTSWTLIFADFWIKAYPEAKWLFTSRNIDSIINSMNRHPGMKRHVNKSQFVSALQHRSAKVIGLAKYWHGVDVKALSQCNKKEINKLFIFLNMDENKEIIETWLQPELMK